MDCSEFLRQYGDSPHGALPRRLETHRRACPRCARWVEAVDRGVAALREASSIEPSPGFRGALERRLRAEVRIGDPITPTHAGLAAAFLLATAVGLFMYEGWTRPDPAEPLPAARLADAPTLADSLDAVPKPEPVNVTIPAFGEATLEFHSSQAPLGTEVVFSR